MKLGNAKFHNCTIFLETKMLYILDPFLAFKGNDHSYNLQNTSTFDTKQQHILWNESLFAIIF